MSNTLVPVPGDGISRKSPWEKPGGTLGMIFAGVATAGGLMLLWHLLPILITLASNVLYLILILAAIGILGYILTSKRFWHTFGTAYFIIMRKITGFFISIDPVAILDEYVKDLEKKIERADKAIKDFRGLTEKNRRRLQETKEKLADNLAKKKYYEQRGEHVFAAQVNSLIVLHENAKKNREERLETSEKWLKALSEVKKNARFSVDVTKEKIQIFKEEYEEIKAAGKATRSLKAAFSGDPDIMEDFEMAVEIMETQISADLGEISEMMDATDGMLAQADLDNAVVDARATEILNKYDQKSGIFDENRFKALEDKGDYSVKMPEEGIKLKRPSTGSESFFD